MDHGLSPQDLEEIISALRRFPEIESAILFGSRAKGNYKPGSDVDIAIKGSAIEHSCVSGLSSLLNEETSLPYYFDIVHFEGISERPLVEHIERVGKTVYQRERNAADPASDS